MSTAVWKYSMHSGPIEVMISVSLPTVWNQGNGWFSWCGTPKTYSRPCRRGKRAAMSRASGCPTASTQKSTIFPPVCCPHDLDDVLLRGVDHAVAPSRVAQRRRHATRSMPITWLAPIRRRRCVKIKPIGPWPTTAQRWLMTGPVRAIARKYRGQRLGYYHGGQVGQMVGQAGQAGRLRADKLRKAVVVVRMGQDGRALRPILARERTMTPMFSWPSQPGGRGIAGLAQRPSYR